MKKIPTLFRRDPDDMRRVTDEVTPGCEWVLAGEGVATRKYDGTCVMLDKDGNWWARREVKPGKNQPANYVPVEFDKNTGKQVGWEPIEQSGFAKFHAEALAERHGVILLDRGIDATPTAGTYELIGPKVNGNPEGCDRHVLVQHGYSAAVEWDDLRTIALDRESLRTWLHAHAEWEGIVWHHPDGRMAKLKGRDFPPSATGAAAVGGGGAR